MNSHPAKPDILRIAKQLAQLTNGGMVELRFLGIHAWMRTGSQTEAFVCSHLPADRQEEFREWCKGRAQEASFRCSGGARVYDVVRRGKHLEVTVRQVGAFSMAEVKQLQASWDPGPGLSSGFMAIEAVGRPDVDQKVRENVANSFAWDKNLERM